MIYNQVILFYSVTSVPPENQALLKASSFLFFDPFSSSFIKVHHKKDVFYQISKKIKNRIFYKRTFVLPLEIMFAFSY